MPKTHIEEEKRQNLDFESLPFPQVRLGECGRVAQGATAEATTDWGLGKIVMGGSVPSVPQGAPQRACYAPHPIPVQALWEKREQVARMALVTEGRGAGGMGRGPETLKHFCPSVLAATTTPTSSIPQGHCHH